MQPMDLFTSQQTRTIDALVIERTPVAGAELMRRAGRACFQALVARWPRAKTIAVFCGTGNNGGDGYVLAKLLLTEGRRVRVHQLGGASTGERGLRGDALQAQEDYLAAGGAVAADGERSAPADVVVDALFGTGMNRPLDDAAQAWVTAVNASGAPVLSVDVPSGLNADTGAPCPRAVRADATVTFIAHKRGMYTAWGRDCCGEIVFDDLGADAGLFEQVEPAARLVGLGDLIQRLPRRRDNVHKGDFGHVLVIGGGPGMAGAARLAGEAALRTGAGKVSVAAAADNVAGIVAACPALMVHGVIPADGAFDALLKRADVVAIGPGLGCDDWGRALLTKTLEARLPKVVDADALNLLAMEPASCDEWVLTPHPGEAGRLLGLTAAAVGADRFAAAEGIAARFGGVCLLKGSGTVIHSREGALVCAGGNPGMASAGMGDVLSGVVAALIAQGLPLPAAAALGACVHAEAGDRAAAGAPRGLIASDLMPQLRACVN